MIAAALQKHFESDTIVQIFAGMDFVAKIYSGFFKCIRMDANAPPALQKQFQSARRLCGHGYKYGHASALKMSHAPQVPDCGRARRKQ